MGAAEFSSARLENQTPDEGVHLVAGYGILREGRFSLNAENPPFAKTLSAIPLLWLDPELPHGEGWQDDNNVTIAGPFLYRNRVSADRILFWGRQPMMVLSLVFGLGLAWWTRYRFGPVAALVALILYCFDPNFIAHSRYATSDTTGAFFYFAAAVAWAEYLLSRRFGWLVAAGVLSAVGICAKFNLLMLLPLFAGLAIWMGSFRKFAVYLGIVVATVWAIYGFELRTIASDEPIARFLRLSSAEVRASKVLPPFAVAMLDPATSTGAFVHNCAQNAPIPAYSFFKGIYRLANHSYWGHPAYLLGQVGTHGWWYYFLVAFLVKTPDGLMVLLVLAGLRYKRSTSGGRLLLPMLLVTATAYFVVAMTSSINIGHRHILPVYPFLFVFIGAVAAGSRGWWRRGMVFAVLLVVVESAAIHPHYLAYFNLASGGSGNGARYLVDSNLDWGQDALKLKAYMRERNITSMPLRYFGSADLDYYGIKWEPLEDAVRSGRQGRVAISATALEMDPDLAGFRKCRPVDRVGYSIYVFEVRAAGL
jgi:hypothetical protein